MARTKMTAPRSESGLRPRKQLATMTSRKPQNGALNNATSQPSRYAGSDSSVTNLSMPLVENSKGETKQQGQQVSGANANAYANANAKGGSDDDGTDSTSRDGNIMEESGNEKEDTPPNQFKGDSVETNSIGVLGNDSNGTANDFDASFEDKEDCAAFGGDWEYVSQEDRMRADTEIFLPLKHKEKDEFEFDYCINDEELDWPDVALKRLGHFLSRATHLKKVTLSSIFDKDISLLLNGPPVTYEYSVEELSIWFFDDGILPPTQKAIDSICDFLGRTPKLKVLNIGGFEFDKNTARSLSLILQKVKLESLSLDNILYDWDSSHSEHGAITAFLIMMDISKLKHLSVEEGHQWDLPMDALRTAFAALRDYDCSLKSLTLSASFDCQKEERKKALSELLWSLDKNKSLTDVILRGFPYEELGEKTLKKLDRFLFNPSSIDSVICSNHSLRVEQGLCTPSRNPLVASLRHSLAINRAEIKPCNSNSGSYYTKDNIKLRRNMKITRFLTMGNTLNTKLFENFDAELMPKVVGFLGNKHFYSSRVFLGRVVNVCEWNGRAVKPIDTVFCLLRSFPSLCGFHSPERARLTASIDRLVKENEMLRSQIKSLEQRNDGRELKRPRHE